MSAVALGVLFLSSMAKTTTASRKTAKTTLVTQLPAGLTPQDVLRDYRIGVESREASLLGRREVLTGKAKFGIFGDGKELPQLAMARAFRHGDWRSGYYRDQTWMFALGVHSIQEFFAQLYAHADVEHDPATAGRSSRPRRTTGER